MTIYPTTQYLNSLFEAWNEAGISYVVLRNYENLPEDIGNDLDILVAPEQLLEAERLLIHAFEDCGAVMHNRARFSCIGLFFYDPNTLKQYQVDLFPSVDWRGFKLLESERLLARRVALKNFYVPCPLDEAFVSLLTKLLYAGYIKERYKEQIRNVCHDETDQFIQQMQFLFGRRKAGDIVAGILSKDWASIEQTVRTLRRQLMLRSLKRPLLLFSSLWRDMMRLITRAIHPPGLCIVMIGPDGCGKTSVGLRVNEKLDGTFHGHATRHIHWKPRLLKKMSDKADPHGTPCTDPHGLPMRPPVANMLYFLAHSLEIIPAWLLRVHPVLFKNHLVLIDRYYYDFMVDPRRFRLKVSDSLAWFVYRFIPKPGLVICLDAPAEVLQSRKQEVSFSECARQRNAYRALAERLVNARMADATQPLEQVVDAVTTTVLDYMAHRCASGRQKID